MTIDCYDEHASQKPKRADQSSLALALGRHRCTCRCRAASRPLVAAGQVSRTRASGRPSAHLLGSVVRTVRGACLRPHPAAGCTWGLGNALTPRLRGSTRHEGRRPTRSCRRHRPALGQARRRSNVGMSSLLAYCSLI